MVVRKIVCAPVEDTPAFLVACDHQAKAFYGLSRHVCGK
jgi:hypothetical protein